MNFSVLEQPVEACNKFDKNNPSTSIQELPKNITQQISFGKKKKRKYRHIGPSFDLLKSWFALCLLE